MREIFKTLIGIELLNGQSHDGINLNFLVKFDPEGQGQSPPKQ